MPFLITLFSVAGAAFAYWFIRLDGHEVVGAMFSSAARDRRRRRARDSEARSAARSITDPRDAALALLVRIGSVDGDMLPAAEAIVRRAGQEVFQYGAEYTERRTFAGFVARNTPSFNMLAQETGALLRQKLSTSERAELLALLRETAEAAGGINETRQDMIDLIATQLGEKTSSMSNP